MYVDSVDGNWWGKRVRTRCLDRACRSQREGREPSDLNRDQVVAIGLYFINQGRNGEKKEICSLLRIIHDGSAAARRPRQARAVGPYVKSDKG